MDSNPIIFDISSDEEPTFDERSRSGCDDDHQWFTNLLLSFDKETPDSDDVVVVGEYNPSKPKSKCWKPVKGVEDDDCVVLDGNPDKPVDVADDPASDGDDVLVVGQTGQIACRDYPHPRHLCAKFPFSSTPHQKHCDLCHCYVCDSLAPCVHWGTGLSTIDHCHATDKVVTWKSQRENFRLGKNASLPPAPGFQNGCHPVAVSQAHQVPALDVQNQVSRPSSIRACSSSRMTIPSMTRHYNTTRQTAGAHGRNGFMSHSVSQQPRCNNFMLRNRGQQFVSNNTMFKRPGIIKRRNGFACNQSVYGSPNNINCAPASNYVGNTVSLAAASAKNLTEWQDVLTNTTPESYTYQISSQPNMSSVHIDTVPLQPEALSQPIPQSNDGQSIYQLGNQSQNVLDSSFPEFDLWMNNLNSCNQQASAEDVPLHGTVNKPVVVEQLTSQLDESTEIQQKDPDFENWLLNESEACVADNMNAFSPGPPILDVSMLCFDFETSWNGLAHV